MHDAVEIERRGKPAAVVITDKFVVTARARAEVLGVPDYPMAAVEHPIGRLPDEVLKARAEKQTVTIPVPLVRARAGRITTVLLYLTSVWMA